MAAIPLDQLFVLIVEPSAMQRRIITDALKRQGVINTSTANSGQDALEQLSADQPDLVVSSLYLPDMTGTDLVHRIRESEINPDLPFMLISSETRFRYLDPIRQAGVVGILSKPFTDADLRMALGTTVELLDEDDGLSDLDPESLQVLVVDDSRMARNHITRVLNNLGIQRVDHAADGVEALAKMDAGYYDFVVTDYNMPRMDGGELVDQIRHSASNASIPVLMVTSESNENRLAAVQQSGISAICDKPFEPSLVRGLIREMVTG